MAGQNFEKILQHLKKTLKRFCSSSNVIVGHLCVQSLPECMGLNVCECTGKAESHPGRWVSSHSCLTKVL